MKMLHLMFRRSPDAEGSGEVVETTEAPETTEATTTTEAPETTETPETTEGDPAEGGETTEPPAYTPNFKFKVMDKEYEFDKRLQGVVKTAEDEKWLRDLHNKAFGLEHVQKKVDKFKSEVEAIRGEHTEYKGKVDPIIDQLREADHWLAESNKDINNLGNVFEVLGIPVQKVLQYGLHVAKLLEMDPGQRAAYEQARANGRQVYQTQSQNTRLQGQMSDTAVQTRTSELQTVLTSPEIKQAADKIDSMFGKPGTFIEEVLRHAKWVAREEKKDLSALDAVNAVLEKYGAILKLGAPGAAAAAAPTTGGTQTPPTAPAQAKQDPPVIPTVASRQAAPVKKQYKSLNELREKAQSL
jgi:hypothetical protein